MSREIKVLLVDDDRMILRIISTMLSRKGYLVYTSNTAADILSIVEKYKPDIILMDYQMPVVSGIEAIELLKSNELSMPVPIIFFSVHESMAAKGIKAGAAMYVSKASSAEHLAACIDGLVNTK
jgi:CheY-like chemotaxis protein